LGFEAAEDGLTLDDFELHALYLIVEEGVERHDGEEGWTAWVENEDEKGERDAMTDRRRIMLY